MYSIQHYNYFEANDLIMLPSSKHSLDSYFSASVNRESDRDEMRYEWLRLRSFSTFPLISSSHSPVRLARSGFYYTGRGQECVCFSCGVHHCDWTESSVTEIHRRLCPECRHLNGHDVTNIPIESNDSSESSHLLSELSKRKANNSENANASRRVPDSANGIQNTTNTQYQAPIQNQKPSIPRSHHTREMLEPLGINFDRPKYPSYSVLATRISSYQQWPSYLTQTPRDLSIAGFFYVGCGDYVRCFFCGGGLRNWEPGDEAWVEHARWFPKCSFLLQNRGADFVTLVQSVQNEQSEVISSENLPTSSTIEQLPAAVKVREMGYSWEIIKAAFSHFKKSETVTVEELIDKILADKAATPNKSEGNSQDIEVNPQNTSLPANAVEPCKTNAANGTVNADLSDELNSLSLSDETQILLDENRRLREQRLCKICMEEDITIAFLPCGHLCCCAHCAPAMRKCPICRAFIKGTVKTYPA